MANTTSLAFPRMFDVSRNAVSVLEDNVSIVNRSRLLILTEPTELYNSPDFGAGLKRHMFKYTTSNEKSIILDRIIDQLRIHEPCVDADKTAAADGLIYTDSGESSSPLQDYNKLKMTMQMSTVFGDIAELNLNNDIQNILSNAPYTLGSDGRKKY